MNQSPLELIRLGNLQLAAKIVSEELQEGVHLGKKIGTGTAFEQYRHYEPGDDPKRIDWKLFARSDKYLVKESTIESNLNIRFILDLSGSMNYEEKGVSRLAYANVLIASLAYIGMLQHDKMSLYTLKNGNLELVVANRGKPFQRILYTLDQVKAEGSWPDRHPQFPHLQYREKELVIFISDLLQTDREWVDLIASMSHPRREIVIFQILGDQELTLDLDGFYQFEDLESGKTLALETRAARKKYNERIHEYLHELDRSLHLPQVHLLRTTLSQPIPHLIKKYLNKRKLS
ncbi:DUF58 domain-containing protein [Anditalea andensis]|uniref:DUF58 domain-containing protein n=1 Tax=Anditalea andensis TaxID=1048983 RepID=A0A074KYX3_9BACT|nr:DUF58 domain-containing protein [Anditalea andensis]KEO75166.1 hypothetical protein EL17_05720 [Anditalea andensis]